MNEDFIHIQKILMDGNKRFVKGKLKNKDFFSELRKDLYQNGQKPIAAVISCADSRVPPEYVFDTSLGELFVIRNAGNIVDETVIENVEFAVSHLGVRFILILAHECCGAVQEALDKLEKHEKLEGFIKALETSIVSVQSENEKSSLQELAPEIEEENAIKAADKLLESKMLKELYNEGKIEIVTAKYFLSTGEVKIIDR